MAITNEESLNRAWERYEGKIPTSTLQTLGLYILHGIPTGDFCDQVLTNDFMGACGRADEHNSKCLIEISRFVYNELPAGCWGSREKVKAWLDHKGWEGYEDREQ